MEGSECVLQREQTRQERFDARIVAAQKSACDEVFSDFSVRMIAAVRFDVKAVAGLERARQ
jgi:hypothetical protein